MNLIPKKRPLRAALGLLVGSGFAVAACAYRGAPAQSSLNAANAAPSASSNGATALGALGGSSGSASEAFDLEAFTPLLALAELHTAREAADDGAPARAAAETRRVLAEKPRSDAEALRFEYLIARLEESAGNLSAATASYEKAASAQWELSDYARLGRARTLIGAGKFTEALTILAALPTEGPIAVSARPLIVTAAEQDGKLDQAIEALRAEMLAGPTRSERLALARLLLERVGKSPDRPEEQRLNDVREAALAADAAELGSSTTSEDGRAARELGRTARKLLPSAEQASGVRAPELELAHVEGLEQAGYPEEALLAAEALESRLEPKYGAVGCRLAYVRAKLHAGQKKWGKAVDELTIPAERCREDGDFRARLLFLIGKYAQADDRYAAAVRYFEMLEMEFPKHRLADDARLKRAQIYMRMGAEARFTELLGSMSEDYPSGDMTMDGVIELSMRRIEKQDWSGAASVLERGAALVRGKDSARGTEYSGRERYFLARARYEMGDKKHALDEYESIVRELPLSYYMLHAYSRLRSLDAPRAQAALEEGLRRGNDRPFSFVMRPEFQRPEFRRALELMRVGDLAGGRSELAALGLEDGADSALLWGVALLYGRAGAAGESHGIARQKLTDWFAHWPVGAWRAPWELGFPRPYPKVVERESKRSQVPASLIYAIMREESAFDPDAQSPAQAYGLMQLIVPTAQIYGKRLNLPYQASALRQPSVNVALGSTFLRDLTTRFEQNPLLAIPGYNAGPGRPARWLKERPAVDFDVWVELIPLIETRRYTKRVLASRAAYAYLYDAEAGETALRLPLRLEAP